MAFLGIDVSKEKVDVFLLVNQRSSYRIFANSMSGFLELSGWLQLEQVHLFAEGHTVSILNPAVLVNYRKSRNTRSKTDRLDARLLAQYGQQLQPPAWHPLPEEILALRNLLAYRDEVQLQLLQARNRQRTGLRDPWVADRMQAWSEQLVIELKHAL